MNNYKKIGIISITLFLLLLPFIQAESNNYNAWVRDNKIDLEEGSGLCPNGYILFFDGGEMRCQDINDLNLTELTVVYLNVSVIDDRYLNVSRANVTDAIQTNQMFYDNKLEIHTTNTGVLFNVTLDNTWFNITTFNSGAGDVWREPLAIREHEFWYPEGTAFFGRPYVGPDGNPNAGGFAKFTINGQQFRITASTGAGSIFQRVNNKFALAVRNETETIEHNFTSTYGRPLRGQTPEQTLYFNGTSKWNDTIHIISDAGSGTNGALVHVEPENEFTSTFLFYLHGDYKPSLISAPFRYNFKVTDVGSTRPTLTTTYATIEDDTDENDLKIYGYYSNIKPADKIDFGNLTFGDKTYWHFYGITSQFIDFGLNGTSTVGGIRLEGPGTWLQGVIDDQGGSTSLYGLYVNNYDKAANTSYEIYIDDVGDTFLGHDNARVILGTGEDGVNMTFDGTNFVIETTNQSLVWLLSNISAEAVIDRTPVWDTAKWGNATDNIKSSKSLKGPSGNLEHSQLSEAEQAIIKTRDQNNCSEYYIELERYCQNITYEEIANPFVYVCDEKVNVNASCTMTNSCEVVDVCGYQKNPDPEIITTSTALCGLKQDELKPELKAQKYTEQDKRVECEEKTIIARDMSMSVSKHEEALYEVIERIEALENAK